LVLKGGITLAFADRMVSGSEYQVVVGIVNGFGNKTFREINMETLH